MKCGELYLDNMNIKNLNQQELEQLQMLLNKMNPQPTEKVYLDPVNKMIDEIMDEFDFNRIETVEVANAVGLGQASELKEK